MNETSSGSRQASPMHSDGVDIHGTDHNSFQRIAVVWINVATPKTVLVEFKHEVTPVQLASLKQLLGSWSD